MTILLTVLYVVILVVLLVVSGIHPQISSHSRFELQRRAHDGDDEAKLLLKRHSLLRDIFSLQRVVSAMLLVLLSLLGVQLFHWTVGFLISLLIALESGAVARVSLWQRYSQQLYERYEGKLLTFIEKHPLIFRAIRSVAPLPNDTYDIESKEELLEMVAQAGDVLTRDEKKLITNGLNFETMRKKLFDYKAARIAVVNGKEVWKSIVRTYMLNLDDLEIVSQFNAEIRGFYNYYSIANNSYVINSFYHIMSYSMYKVFANKYKSSVKKILLKYKKNKVFQVAYENSKGKTLYQSFYHDGFKRKKVAGNIYCDTIPRTVSITGGRNSLMERLKLQVCELCGATDKLEMHHVRKLKDLKGKSDWEKKMIARRRKTLAVCSKCHAKIDPDRRIRLN